MDSLTNRMCRSRRPLSEAILANELPVDAEPIRDGVSRRADKSALLIREYIRRKTPHLNPKTKYALQRDGSCFVSYVSSCPAADALIYETAEAFIPKDEQVTLYRLIELRGKMRFVIWAEHE